MALPVPKWVKYPKLLTLTATFILAYLFVNDAALAPLREYLAGTGYIGVFFAGIMYVYGFTAAPGTALLLVLAKTLNIYAAAALAGVGALLGDLVIYRIVRHSFADELITFSKEWAVITIISHVPKKLINFILPVLGALVIASPLPDEIGVMILATSASVSEKNFFVISYALNTAGILVVLWLGSGA